MLRCHDVAFTFFFFGKANAAFWNQSLQSLINDDPKMTLTYIMAKSNVIICVLGVGITECLK